MINGSKRKKNKRKSIRTLLSMIKLLILIGLIAGIPLYVYWVHPDIIESFKNLESINQLLLNYKTASIFAYIALQIMQILISVLPGQALQFAAGYAYNFWLGYVYSLIGVMAGTIITFYLAKILGKDAIHIIFGEEKVNRFICDLNSKRAYTILFVIFLIPGVPKDLLTYVAGVSEIKIKPFLLLSATGRTPAMMGSIMMGSMFKSGSYIGLIILGVIAVAACIAGVLKREKILQWSDKAYYKLIKSNKE